MKKIRGIVMKIRRIVMKDVVGKDGGKLRTTLFPILGIIVEQSRVLEK